MKTTLIMAVAAAISSSSAFADDQHNKHHLTLDDVAWQQSGIPGVELGLAWGDPAGDDAIRLLRIAPGVSVPSHTHTNDYWGMTITGTWVHVHEDGSETSTTVGDYAFVEGGVPHSDRCDGTEPCIGLLDFDGAQDIRFPK
ncbi:cupin domain-containing protein [Roseobacteraceae bacterium S113]